MRRLRKFWGLPRAERMLLVKSWLLLGAIGLGLSVLPFGVMRRLLEKGARERALRPPVDDATSKKVVWAVTAASRYVPRGGTCLTRALAVRHLLARRGTWTNLRIGVMKEGKDASLGAHAWVEHEGRILIGDLDDLSRYTPMPPLLEKDER